MDTNTPQAVAIPTVLVLGATGFIGQALVKRLLQEGFQVRALIRGRGRMALWGLGVDVIQGDLANSAALVAALEGIEHVYHLASGKGGAWKDCLAQDIEPTRRLAELCSARGITLHYTSSIAIYDGSDPRATITETTSPCLAAQRLSSYAKVKVANEQMLAELHRTHGLKAVVYRPGIVIGAGGELRHPGVGAWPFETVCRPWGGGEHVLPFVLVEDCVDAMVRASRLPELAGKSFNLVGDAWLTGNEYLDALEQAAIIRIRRAPLPTWQLFGQSVVRWALNRQRQGGQRVLPSYRYCEGLSCRATYSTAAAKRHLGWAPIQDRGTLISRGVFFRQAQGSALLPRRPRPTDITLSGPTAVRPN